MKDENRKTRGKESNVERTQKDEDMQDRDGEETPQSRQFLQSPAPRRPNPDSRAYGGWDVIDSLTITQCVVRPPGMQTVEIIPNSL